MNVTRREFLELSAATTTGLALSKNVLADNSAKPVRVGIVGTGRRGKSLLGTMLQIENIQVPALCDIDRKALSMARDIAVKAGRPKPQGYSKDEYVFKKLMNRDDLDAVIIATPWHWHTPLAVYGMEHGKYIGVEVPAAISLDECWQLVNTHEKTGVPCMMMENWSFRRDNLAI